MKVRDRELKRDVDVCDRFCLCANCYYPRLDPGVFIPGIGYRHRSDNYLCGTRKIAGCPTTVNYQRDNMTKKQFKEMCKGLRDAGWVVVDYQPNVPFAIYQKGTQTTKIGRDPKEAKR